MKLQQYGLPRGSRKMLSVWTILLYYFCEVHTQIQATLAKDNTQNGSRPARYTGERGTEQQITDWTSFRFKHPLYNVTIPENSIGKTYAKSLPYEDLMGLRVVPHCEVKFRIISGDRDKLFKAEDRIVGDFAFLTIRTRTGNVVLNREKNEDYLLRVKAAVKYFSASNVTTFETETTVYIKVLDRNDLSPLFYPTEYSKTIPEDMPLHRSVIKVFAEDADLGVNGEIYYSFSTENDYFSIHPTTGVITLVKKLHFIENSYFELIVLANDRGSAINHYSHQSSKAKVQISIKQVNLYAPEIYVKTLPNAAMDTNSLIYGIVRVNDKDTGRHGEIRKLEIVDGDPDGNFNIRSTEVNGEYYIQINRLAKLAQRMYNLTIRAEDKGVPAQYSYKATSVNIVNKHSHSPVFTKELYEISIAETSPPNMPVLRLKVIDPDLSRNALVFLEIVGGNEGGEFRINPDSGMLYTQKSLDAETKAFYTLTVSAIDQSNISVRKQSSAKVKINIEDMNDNDPVFDNINSTVMLEENKPAGTFVVKVTAKDKDSGENSYLTYSIANLNDVPFEIDHFSGVIKTTVLIDYETMQRNFLLSIRASDWGLPYRRQTELNLMIQIKNINDNRPQFERVNCVGKIWRNAPVGTDIFTLSAIDFDVGDYITYRLISGNEDGCFNLDPTTGVLSVGCDLSDVSVASRVINVSATDGTHFSDELSIHVTIVNEGTDDSYQHIDVLKGYGSFECRETGVARRSAEIAAAAEKNNANTLKSLNDLPPTPNRYRKNAHAPEFLDFPLELKINESLQLGETVVQIKARDRDLGYNGKLVYAITDGDYDSVFRVDADTGELQIIGYLDRERQDHYTLNITVYDLGQPQKLQSKLLPVTILDNNDNPPVFQKSLASFRLTENALNGTIVFCLNATDADANDNARVTYTMQTETHDFYLNRSTGCISVNSALDREKQKDYELHIMAKDGGVPPLTAEAIVNIQLEDINDNAPLFGVQELIFEVREDVPRGTTIATVEAIDFDSGPNGEIYFSLKEDKMDNGLFKINKYSGVIQTRGYLDYETRQVHNLIVSAIDRGTPSLTSDMPVVIEVLDVNENRFAPEFDDFVYNGSIKENEPKGTFIMNITARDLDVNELDAKVSYSIVGGDGLGVFAVNDKGSIRTLSHLDAESKNSYWITLCAQDHAIVPLSSCVQVYIKVENVNDNVPLSDKPVYYHSIPEGSPQKTKILKLQASDKDNDPLQHISYKITSGNPEGFFTLNSTTGELMTTERKLDRENQSEHILEIAISDNGDPPLSSITRVVITVEDINDNAPEFDQRFYKIHVPSTTGINETVFQVQAFDNDIGENGRISYSLKSGKGKNKFHIDANTGYIYISKPLDLDVEYELNIRAEDNGSPSRSQNARLNIAVVPIIQKSNHPPTIKANSIVDVTETDRPGFLVALIQAIDEDDDHLWYNISAGDTRNEFFIGRDNGNVLLAKSLDWETQQSYNLTISVTDGVHSVQTLLHVKVVDTNDNRPQFTESTYSVNISENIEEETIIMQLHATDRDEDKKIFYMLHAAQEPTSLTLFRIDSLTGNVLVTQHLDYEKTKQHVLIVMARDQGTPSKRDYAQIIITVHDHNDHYPEFTNRIIQCKFPESAAVGAKVVQLQALDRDSGKNAEINYSIHSGNVGNAFNIDTRLGTLTLAKPLDFSQIQEYMLNVRAIDLGEPPLSSQLPVHIRLIMAENDPPKFAHPSITLEIYENLQIGTFVLQVDARSSSSVFYDIEAGNEDDLFRINPSTGVIVTNGKIDYEMKRSFNLTIVATNMASASAQQSLLIHILDLNDNAPYFLQREYVGEILESANIGSFVILKGSFKNSPLVLNSSDADTGINSIVNYSIMDEMANRYFEIDSLTGTIKLISPLDYETMPEFKFKVVVNDMGTPKLFSDILASIHIYVDDVNDCPPVFESKEITAVLFVPTYANVIVTQVKATDADLNGNSTLRYDIVDGNEENCFQIDSEKGIITTRTAELTKAYFTVYVRASDGLYSALVQINIKIEPTSSEGFTFQKLRYEFFTIENSTKISTVGLVNVVGNMLHEYINFRILNPTNMFQIGPTSGVIKTTGVVFDRELQDNYTLIVEAKSLHISDEHVRRAHVVVDILILDINDNCPMFVNLPYYAIVSVDDVKGSLVTAVKAVDLDSGENGEVRYEMKKGNGELFKVDRKTGEITLKQSVERRSSDYTLIVSAYDGAITPCSTDITVTIKIVDKSMPIFDKQFYFGSVKEDVEVFSALPIEIRAESPLQRKLIYTISKGNEDELFEIDYRTGTMYVVNSLDYETKPSHELMIRATDGVTGIFAEVTVSITVEDANDCYPSLEKDFYNVTLLENLKPGTPILKLNATDCDQGLNGETYFTVENSRAIQNDSKIFSIDPTSGSLYLKSMLDYETKTTHLLVITVKDRGTPSLSTKVNVWITVRNVNDNSPKFSEPSFSCFISAKANRGQFVFKAKAYDMDVTDNDKLTYKIVDGNELQTFAIAPTSGIISLQSTQNFTNNQNSVLNVSVTDGIHTSYARVKISIMPENLHSPVFTKPVYEATIDENELPGVQIKTIKAYDPDLGKYSDISYELPSTEMRNYFDLHPSSGVLTSKISFDREKRRQYEVFVRAADGGGRVSYALIKVKINDRNDNPPIFPVKEYRATIKIDTELNSSILKLKAIDADQSGMESLRYVIDPKTLEKPYAEFLHLNESSGELQLIKSPGGSLLNKELQFFVKAFDGDEPHLHSAVPVSILFIDSSIELPVPENPLINVNVLESTPPGTVLCKLKLLGNYSIKFSIISDAATFSVSESGELLLIQTLDREENELHYVMVLAETTTTPSLFAISEIYVHVKDENDNYPMFDSHFYSVEIAENVDKVSSILKVTATDLDAGPNGDIRYYLDESKVVSDVFDIDIYSGWITSLKQLDRETQSEYYFNVLATDNGQPKHVSKTSVAIKIVDYNDNPALFTENQYKVSVLENALPGTVLSQFFLTDLDSEKSETMFEVIAGDNYSQFQVGKNGELFVSRGLDRESIAKYELSLIATDGKFISQTEVTVAIDDVNDNEPFCITPRYHVRVNESTPLGTPILRTKAIDFDENANQKIRYYLTGDNCEDFAIEKESGVVKVARSIDRERYPKYVLIGHAQDGEELQRECTFEIFITVQDINDNRPEFSMQQYIVSVPEDAHIHTLLTKLHATDKDFGLNRKIAYSLFEPHSHFNVCSSTGIVKLMQTLDRESVPMYNLSIRAEDYGVPKLYATANLIVNVLDINDNPPEFASKEYVAYLLENATVSTSVAKVFATSKDIGVNAEIRYFIVGGNEHKKFRIESKTGVIYVDGEIDYEKTKNYFLTVQALDGGTPPLSSLASVNVSIVDVNDNAPKFTQNLYHIQIPEDILKHEKIIQVLATDEDSQQNGIIHFHIENGDKQKQFAIDEPSGSMYTTDLLDRESIPVYKIEIRACDNGTPELCSFAQVHIDVVDVNDNAPLFSKSNYSVYLRENKEIGHVLLTFDITDADVVPNTHPYTFDFRLGNDGDLFRLEQDGKLRTAGRFNHKLRSRYDLLIRVFDDGTPPLYSDAWVTVVVIEESQYPPLLTPLEITVNSFDDEFAGGYLGQVHASDQDKYDMLQYSLAPTIGEPYITKSLFNLSSDTGLLFAISNLDVGYYKVNVTVTDGKYVAHSLVKITVELITAEMVRNAVIVRFSKVSPEEFILSHRKGFNRFLRSAMSCRQKDVYIITVQNSTDTSIAFNQVSDQRSRRRRSINEVDTILDVVVAVKKQQIIPNSERFFSPKEIHAALAKRVEEANDMTNLVLEDIVVPQCLENSCVNGHCLSHVVLSKNKVLTISTDVISFATPSFEQVNECHCKEGFDGVKCDISVNACSSNPCQPQQECLPSNSVLGYQCICPTGYTGQLCETASNRCSNASCSNALTSVSFSGKSYAHYRINKFLAKNAVEKQFIYSLKVRTMQQTGTLLYASGTIDFNVLEIVNGAVQYRFDLGSGEGIVAVTSIFVSDGEWHSIYLERVLNSAKLIVDKKHVSQSSAPGVNELLNIQSNDIFVGAEVRPHPSIIGFEDIQKGFIGCMADIKLSYQPLPLYISGGSSIAALKRFTNVEFTCDPASVLVSLGICGAQPCLNGGICSENDNNTFKCNCYPRFTGRLCETDLDPCASNPCLYGGRCEQNSPGNYTCHCPMHLSGRRCENGKFCSPNPCKNNGICEEGDGLPHCLCRGFTGPTCEIDINECENLPCGHGATCINEAGSFRCICPYYLTGASCGDPLYSNSISTKLKNLSREHLTGIISGTSLIVVIIVVVLCCLVLRKNASTINKRNIKSIRRANCKEHNLNSLLDKEKYCKPNPKLSNLEVNQRPLSYTASGSDNFPNHAFLNNLDVLQSYGSAGDELENIPFEYQKINRTYQKRNINGCTTPSNMDALQLQKGCCEQMHLKTFSENKLNNATLKPTCGKLIQVPLPNICRSTYADDPSTVSHGEYHWDCSDWIRKSQNPLPDITEVPGAEVADSSSFHSDDSNESKARTTHLTQCYGKVNPDRDITTLNEDMSEYAESDMGSSSRANVFPLIAGESLSRLSTNNKNQDYLLNTVPLKMENNIPHMMYLHSHSYISPLNNPSETEAESCATGLLLGEETDKENTLVRKSYKTGSNSDLSVHICEIEDLELEEFLPTDQPL